MNLSNTEYVLNFGWFYPFWTVEPVTEKFVDDTQITVFRDIRASLTTPFFSKRTKLTQSERDWFAEKTQNTIITEW